MLQNWAGVALVAVAMIAGTGEASAAPSHRHIDRVAYNLMKQAQEVQSEVNQHFRRSPQYRHLAEDVREMVRLARHIHEVAHDGGNLRHLRADVRKLDRLYHHIEELVDDLARWREADRQAIRHIRREMREMHDSLEHLRRDLR
jgi:hypothetical protein